MDRKSVTVILHLRSTICVTDPLPMHFISHTHTHTHTYTHTHTHTHVLVQYACSTWNVVYSDA